MRPVHKELAEPVAGLLGAATVDGGPTEEQVPDPSGRRRLAISVA